MIHIFINTPYWYFIDVHIQSVSFMYTFIIELNMYLLCVKQHEYTGISYFSYYQTIMHTKIHIYQSSYFFVLSQPHNAFGTRKRAPPQPKYLVSENYDISNIDYK